MIHFSLISDHLKKLSSMEPKPSFETKIEEPRVMYEPKVLPLEDKGEMYLELGQSYEPQQQDHIEKISWDYFGTPVYKYYLTTEINALEYYFSLSGKLRSEDPFTFVFDTTLYGYAVTNLDEEGTKKLFETIADLFENAYRDTGGNINSISISPADTSYTNEQIEGCMAEIMSKYPKYTREELLKKYKGFKIFTLYFELFRNSYIRENLVSFAQKRSRYFRIQFLRYLKNWKVEQTSALSSSFILTRKKESSAN